MIPICLEPICLELAIQNCQKSGGDTETQDPTDADEILPTDPIEEAALIAEESDEALPEYEIVSAYDNVTRGSDTTPVTRIEWLTALVEAFSMSVEEDNYPDNYYTDVTKDDAAYKTIMIATEYGLVDVEAGDPLERDAYVTREFAAHSLNVCLGYIPEEDSYSYSDTGAVTYQDDMQVAAEHQWFELSDGMICPDQQITKSDMEVMLSDARASIAETTIDSSHSNAWVYKTGVIVLSDSVTEEETDENEITLTNCDTELQEGDIFAFTANGMPVVKRVESLRTEDGKIVVTTGSVDLDDAFESIDIQGTAEGDLTRLEAMDSAAVVSYIVGGSAENEFEDGVRYSSVKAAHGQQISAVQIVRSYDIPQTVQEDYGLPDGVKATIKCYVTNVDADYRLNPNDVYLKMKSTVTFSCNVSLDVLDAVGVSSKVVLAKVPVAYVGYMEITLDMALKGDITLTLVENVSASLYFSKSRGFRIVSDFSKQAFTIQAQAVASAGFKASVGVDWLALKGSLYAKAGATASIKSQTYDDGNLPLKCTHAEAYLYASAGYDASVNLFVYKKSKKDEITFYDKNNSPVRVAQHYEDGNPIAKCSREDDGSSGSSGLWKYYSPIDSRYSYSGANKGTSSAGEEYTIFEYTLNSSNEATITKYHGNVSALNIPETIDGYTVVGIGDSVFKDNKQLRMVVIPDSVTYIGHWAFQNCSNLSSVQLSTNLESRGWSPFGNCDALTSVEIPKSLQSCLSYAPFEGCDNLKTVTFEEGTTKICTYLFKGVGGLETITIPDTVTKIERGAFADDTNLKQVNWGSAITSIEWDAFKNCSSLERVDIPDSVTYIGHYAFQDCSNLRDLHLPASLQSMGWAVFGNCDALTSVEIPKSLQGCLNSGPFDGCDNLKTVTFEEGTTKICTYLFEGTTGLETITIPSTVTAIEKGAFSNAKNLKQVNWGNAVTTVGDYAFEYCTSLEQLMITSELQTIGSYAFMGCSSLNKVTMPDSVTSIGNYAFQNCSKMRSIHLSDSLTTLNGSLFSGCKALTDVNYPAALTTIGNEVFYDCDALTTTEIPNTVTSLGSKVFYDCDALTSVKISDAVTKTGDYAFYGCDALKDITFGTGLTTISQYAFYGCGKIEEIKLPYRLTTIDGYAFANCTSLTKVTIPRSVTSIADTAFSYPAKMTIYGISGTYAETYANNKGITFVNQEKPATEITLSSTELTLSKGASAQLTLSVTPADFTDSVTFKSTNTSVATVDDAGTVKAVGLGTAKIKVTVGDLSKTCQVTVVQPVTSIRLNKTTATLEGGNTLQLTATVYPTDAYDKTVSWSTSDDTVATVDEYGLVTAIKKGSAVITAMAGDGSGVKSTCTVTVSNTCYRVTDVADLQSSHPYENNCTDSWIYTVANAERIRVTFSADTEIEEDFDYLYLYDKDGNQIGKYTGSELARESIEIEGDTVRIQLISDNATTGYGFRVEDIRAVGKTIALTSIRLDQQQLTLAMGESQQLTVLYTPENTTDERTVNWSSSNENAVTVSDTGVVTAVGTGTSVITASVGKCKANATVTVTARLTGLTLPEELTIPLGDSTILSVVPVPENTTDDTSVLWESSDETTVSVDEAGNLTALAEGEAVITAIAQADNAITAACRVTVGNRYIHFDSQGGSEIEDLAWGFGTRPDLSGIVPEKEGFVFTGWYTETACITLWEDAEVSSEEDITLYAGWKEAEGEFWVMEIPDQTYTGAAIKPEIAVYDGATRLTVKKDYKITYKNNKNVYDGTDETKMPQVVVTGQGNYKGTQTITFRIVPKSLEDADIRIDSIYKAVNGKVQKVLPTVYWSKKKLTYNAKNETKSDYTLEYPEGDYKSAGEYQIKVIGRGNYTGTAIFHLTLTDKRLLSNSKLKVKYSSKLAYQDGEAVTQPNLQVTWAKEQLIEGTDYAVTYQNNTDVGTATLILTGLGDYAGEKTITYTITGKKLSSAKVTGIVAKEYTGGAVYQQYSIAAGSTRLILHKDYELTYQNNVNVGKATMTFTGIGAYTGTVKKTFQITAYSMKQNTKGYLAASMDNSEVIYAKSGAKAAVTVTFRGKELTEGKDYTLAYANHKAVNDGSGKKLPTVTIKGKGNYKDSTSLTYTIAMADIGNGSVQAVDVVYKNKKNAYKATPTVYGVDGSKLAKGTDYDKTFIYRYNSADGEEIGADEIPAAGSVIYVGVTGKKNYQGSIGTTYRIVEKSINTSKVKVKIKDQSYTGSAVTITQDDIVSILDGKEVIGTDEYEIVEGSYQNNVKKGKASVKIRGLGRYGGEKTVTFQILAKSIE